MKFVYVLIISIFLMGFLLYPFKAYCQTKDPAYTAFSKLLEESLSYFPVVSGKVVSVHDDRAILDKGQRDRMKKGMRVQLFKEDVSFVHPVTREFLGKVEKPIGTAEVIDVSENTSEVVLLDGEKEGLRDALFKVSMTKIRTLFFQDDINWYLADSYYQKLKEQGRFELIDSSLQTSDFKALTEEAIKKGAEVIIVIDSEKKLHSTTVRQRLFWAKDAKPFSESSITVDPAFVQSLLARSRPFLTADTNILLSYQVSSSISRIAIGDLDGDGQLEIILATSNSLSVYQPSTDLKLLWDIRTPSADQILWIDTVRIEGHRQDSVIVTVYKDGVVDSYIYQIVDGQTTRLAERKNAFLRAFGDRIIEQAYSRLEGFDGKVYFLNYVNGTFTRGESVRLPQGINIYDFSPIESPDGKKAMLAWDDRGVLNLYSPTGVISWRSPEDLGGFTTTIKKDSPIFMIDRGQWAIKDRIMPKSGGVLVPKKIPVFGMAKGLGYRESEINLLWWNGLSVEQTTVVNKLDGEILDFGLLNDRLVVLCKPIMGVRLSNVLKASSPFVNTLYVISVRGLY